MVLHLNTTFTITNKLLKYLLMNAKYWGHKKYIKSSLLKSKRIKRRSLSAFSRSVINFFKLSCQAETPKNLQTRSVPKPQIRNYLRQEIKKKRWYNFFFVYFIVLATFGPNSISSLFKKKSRYAIYQAGFVQLILMVAGKCRVCRSKPLWSIRA